MGGTLSDVLRDPLVETTLKDSKQSHCTWNGNQTEFLLSKCISIKGWVYSAKRLSSLCSAEDYKPRDDVLPARIYLRVCFRLQRRDQPSREWDSRSGGESPSSPPFQMTSPARLLNRPESEEVPEFVPPESSKELKEFDYWFSWKMQSWWLTEWRTKMIDCLKMGGGSIY